MGKNRKWVLAGKKAWRTRRANKAKRQAQTGIPLKAGGDAHRLVVRLLRSGVSSETLQAATGQPRQAIAAIKANDTMGHYAWK